MKQFIRFLSILIIVVLSSGCTERMVEVEGSLYGTVRDAETGEPLSNCNVLLNSLGLATTTGSDGSFHFANLEGGEYSIQVSKNEYTPNTKNITIFPGNESRADILLYRASSTLGSIYGTVHDASSGAPIAGCSVLLIQTGETLITGSDGSFRFQDLLPGKYSVQASKRNYYSNTRSGIGIQAGSSIQVDISLAEFNSNEQLPELSDIIISNLTSSSVRIEASVLNQGSSSVTERGFVYGLTQNLTIDNGVKITTRMGDDNRFYTDINGLQPLTQYYVVSYAMNALGVGYSQISSFTTLAASEEPAPEGVIYVSLSGNDNNDGSSWAQAKQTITAAINGATQEDQIWVSIGTYNETLKPRNGIPVYGGFSGNERDPDDRAKESRTSISRIQCDVYSAETIIDGFKISNQSLGDCVYLRDYAILRNCEISNNKYDVISVSCREKSCIIENCIISGNSLESSGFGVIETDYYGVLTLINCYIQGNSGGCAIFSDGYVETINCVITNNTGGIRARGAGAVLRNTTLASNAEYAVAAESGVQLYNCLVWNNSLNEKFYGASDGVITCEYCNYTLSADNGSVRFIAPISEIGAANWKGANWALSAGSSCIDKGANVFFPTHDVPTDIAGNSRISNGVIDIGAYEY